MIQFGLCDARLLLTAGTDGIAADLVLAVVGCDLASQGGDGAFGRGVCGYRVMLVL